MPFLNIEQQLLDNYEFAKPYWKRATIQISESFQI